MLPSVPIQDSEISKKCVLLIFVMQVECGIDTMWGVDKDNTVWFKEKTNPDLRMQRKQNILIILKSGIN